MAVVLTGSEYIDLDAHGAALDIRSAPVGLYVEINTTDDGTQIVWSHGRDSGVGEYMIYMDGAINFRISTPSGFEDISSPDGFADGSLHRALGIFRPTTSTMELWVDGSMVASTTRSTDSIEDDGSATRIGIREDGSLSFVGEVSNVAVWDAEIASGDAEDLTDGTIAPGDLTTGQLAHWPLDFDARDISGNDLHGSTVGDPDFTETEPDITGSGEAVAPAATVTGTGDVIVSGSGELTAPAATVSGSGTVTAPEDITGSGEAVAPASVAVGTGTVLITGSGEAVAPAAVVFGSDFPEPESVVHIVGRFGPAEVDGSHRLTVDVEGAL